MTKNTNKDLRQNPFTAYRDPKTGQWLIVYNSQSTTVGQSPKAN